MGDAPDELSHGLEFLGLQERRLRALPPPAFLAQPFVRGFQRLGSLGDQAFQILRGVPLGVEIGTNFILAGAPARRGQHRSLKRDRLHRPFQEGNVAQFAHQLPAEPGESRTLVVVGHHDERQVRPGRLRGYPLGQGFHRVFVERFLGEEHHIGTDIELRNQPGDIAAYARLQANLLHQMRASARIPAHRREHEDFGAGHVSRPGCRRPPATDSPRPCRPAYRKRFR